MDFSALIAVKKQTPHSVGDRKTIADTACQQGLELFQQIVYAEPIDLTLYKEAHSQFIKSIQYNRKCVTPYLGVAYLLIFLGDTATARKYLQEALALEPEHAEALKMLKYITAKEMGKLTRSTTTPNRLPPCEPDKLDYDALYDQLDAFISRQLFRINHVLKDLRPTPQLQPLNELGQLKYDFEQAYEKIQQQMKILDDEFDLSELQQRLSPFELSLSFIRKNLQVSERMMAIFVNIQRESSDVLTHLQSLEQVTDPHQLQESERHLEIWLDQCDQIADQLDDMEQAGHSIQELEPPYQLLIEHIEKLRETLDDVKD